MQHAQTADRLLAPRERQSAQPIAEPFACQHADDQVNENAEDTQPLAPTANGFRLIRPRRQPQARDRAENERHQKKHRQLFKKEQTLAGHEHKDRQARQRREPEPSYADQCLAQQHERRPSRTDQKELQGLAFWKLRQTPAYYERPFDDPCDQDDFAKKDRPRSRGLPKHAEKKDEQHYQMSDDDRTKGPLPI